MDNGNQVRLLHFDKTAPGDKAAASLQGTSVASWLILTSILDAPQYLQMAFMLSTHYKLEPDGVNPRRCDVTMPPQAKHQLCQPPLVP